MKGILQVKVTGACVNAHGFCISSTESRFTINRKLPHFFRIFKVKLSHRLTRYRSGMIRRKPSEALKRFRFSRNSPFTGETTLCIAYMCPWAYTCNNAAPRPALVEQRGCIRQLDEAIRPPAGLSEHALDILAEQRRSGKILSPSTTIMLDRLRPQGPSPSFRKKSPSRPIYSTCESSP